MFSLYIEKFIIFCVIMAEFWFFMVYIRCSPRDTAAILLVEKAPVFFWDLVLILFLLLV